MDVMLRMRAVRDATEPRGAEEGEARRKSGCGLPRPAAHAYNDPRNEESCDKTAKRGRYRHRILGQLTEWNAMLHTHAHAQTVGGCKMKRMDSGSVASKEDRRPALNSLG